MSPASTLHAPMGRTGRPRRRSARRGAAGLLFFVLIGVPLLVFSAALAVDFTLQIVTTNQVSAAAESAAQAASFQQGEDQNQLDTARARSAATQTFTAARSEGVMSLAVDPALTSVIVSPQQVEVTADFALPSRTFTKFLLPGVSDDQRFSITRSAQVCTPGSSTQTDGFCASPLP